MPIYKVRTTITRSQKAYITILVSALNDDDAEKTAIRAIKENRNKDFLADWPSPTTSYDALIVRKETYEKGNVNEEPKRGIEDGRATRLYHRKHTENRRNPGRVPGRKKAAT